MDINWKKFNLKVSHIKPGVYLFEFNSDEDMIIVLSRNWTFYHKSPVALKPWTPDLDINSLTFEIAPMWIQLPKLNFHFWTPKGLSKLASYVGNPLQGIS